MLHNKYVLIYGSFVDNLQGICGPFDSESDAEKFWKKSSIKNGQWEYDIHELKPPEDPVNNNERYYRGDN